VAPTLTSTADVCQHVGRRVAFESKPTRALLLPDRCGPGVASRAAGRTSPRLQLPDSVVDLDPRGYPGHFLHYQHLRRVESKVRKSILFAPASFVEGWAITASR